MSPSINLSVAYDPIALFFYLTCGFQLPCSSI
jgi:hypothetical protein